MRSSIGLGVMAFTATASPALGAMRIAFVDAGQADASVTQIDQPTGEPFTILVDGGDADNDLNRSDNLFAPFATAVAADFVSSTGTNRTFMHPRKVAVDLYDTATPNARVFCTCDAAGKKENIVATISNTGAISVTPAQAPYFAWVVVNGTLRRPTLVPTP